VAAKQLTVVRAGRLVDTVAGEVLSQQIVEILGDRIESVGPDQGRYPGGARIVDLSDHIVVPGLVDCHTHLVGELEQGEYATLLMRTGAQEALEGVRNARDSVMAGFTTVRDVGTFRAFADVALRDAIEAGWVVGPRMQCAGAFVTVSSGGGDIPPVAPDVEVPRELRFGVANSPDEVRRAVREILHRGADFIKVIATGAVLTRGTSPGAPEFSEAEIRAGVEEAALNGTVVAAHAHGAEGIKRAVRAGVRSIEHGSLLDDEAIELMAEHGTYLVADIYCGDFIDEEGRRRGWSQEILHKNEQTTDAQREGFAKAVKAGLPVAFGTDSGVYPHGWNARQLPYMVRYGMTSMQALQSATLVAARLMGWEERIGSIEPGKLADLIGAQGDALEDVARFTDLSFVMKGGEVLKGPAPVVA
jgi:imidazolonepropionase-like amidohydrolase